MPPAIARVALSALAYTLLAIWLTWPLAAHLGAGVTSAIDPVDSIWRIGWGQRQLIRHPLRLFAGNTFYPFPDSYLFDELVLGAAVTTLPLALLSAPPLVVYNVAVLLALVASALAMDALARHFGAMPVAAFLAGALYAFAPMHLDRVGHVGLLSAQWFPLILLLLDRVVARPRQRDALALAACLAMQALSSQYYAIYLALLVPLFLAVMALRRPAARRGAVWAHLALAGLLAGAVVLPVAAGYRRMQTDYGLERTPGQTVHYSAALTSFVTADAGNRLWGPITAPLRARGAYTPERNMFPGALALALAALGGWAGRRRPWEQFLAALAALGALLALGPELRATPDGGAPLLRHLPYDLLYWHLPGWDSMRVPARFGALFLLGVAGLAASGATALVRWAAAADRPAFRLGRAAPAAVGALLLLGAGAECATRPLAIVPLERGVSIPPCTAGWPSNGMPA